MAEDYPKHDYVMELDGLHNVCKYAVNNKNQVCPHVVEGPRANKKIKDSVFTKNINKRMLNKKVPYSKAPFWHALLFSISLVTLSQLSSSVEALAAEQDDSEQDSSNPPSADSPINGDDGEGSIY